MFMKFYYYQGITEANCLKKRINWYFNRSLNYVVVIISKVLKLFC